MSAKDLAKKASLENTEARIDAVTTRQAKLESSALPTKYQGHDPQTGTAKFSRGGDCCECNIISGGDLITTGAIGVGEVALSRPTEGNIRLDKRGSTSSPTECGSGGDPNPRRFGGIDGSEPTPDGSETTSTFLYPCPPAGTRVFGSTRFIGLAEVYEIYTGGKIGDPLILDGTTKEINKICATQTVIIPNSPSAQNPTKPYAGINDDGCVNPTDAPTGNLKRCQWYDSTEADALAGIGAPEGMFFSGYIEYPEGVFRILACTEDGEPATDEGTGFDWNPANVIESGAAIEATNYCSGIYQGELNWDSGSITTNNPPISYSLTSNPEISTFQVTLRITSSGGFDELRYIPFECPTDSPPVVLGYVSGSGAYSGLNWTPSGPSDPYPCGTPGATLAPLTFDSPAWKYVIIQANGITGERLHAYTPPGDIVVVSIDQVCVVSQTTTLTVTDNTGTIFTQEYDVEPTNFSYACRSNTPNC